MELSEYQALSEEERMKLRLNNLVAAVHGHELLTEDGFNALQSAAHEQGAADDISADSNTA